MSTDLDECRIDAREAWRASFRSRFAWLSRVQRRKRQRDNEARAKQRERTGK